ncbi:hypothetical protein [Terribacillus saccharophilus]|uniref:Uncharacterized protein n=1 Tax=Terribacillus saccharophilus TaxID=361277 RepID=A0A268AAR3_9BACI|nr:hypothetical protein [Terribacillus saccharophilus]PAD21205.1 hypothetical protein CHH64_09730 [Terribacillus saccharophilus]PAF17096.1 hypothetical protein CHH51_14530 [Terribacillus saccharophilus]PAF21058.1 hypothetical protein CHH49_13510 [Terribacillus saccharophilus]PAF36005.1 hypothetical protein CHH58_13680 [Terribacillus saccharophilus]PAF39724.1 hypothetical protein CHH69_06665 [Terribacillus saccharophilus]
MSKWLIIAGVLVEIIGILLILFWQVDDMLAIITGIVIIVIGVVLFQIGYWRIIRARKRGMKRR